MVEAGDINGDDLLDFSEFMNLNTKDIDLDRVLQDMEKAYDLFDLDGNGSISAGIYDHGVGEFYIFFVLLKRDKVQSCDATFSRWLVRWAYEFRSDNVSDLMADKEKLTWHLCVLAVVST
ncbi:hypothetical protein SUGI_1178400 [Cryptomeria japonica]|nr:hypothetical protein SUGI_1178400 [Cryptomeria japonica]